MRVAPKEMDLTRTQFVGPGRRRVALGRRRTVDPGAARAARQDRRYDGPGPLRSLVRKGYEERATHSSDKRAKNLSLTQEGREIAERSVRLVEATHKEFFGGLEEGPEQLIARLRQLLKADRRRSRE